MSKVCEASIRKRAVPVMYDETNSEMTPKDYKSIACTLDWEVERTLGYMPPSRVRCDAGL